MPATTEIQPPSDGEGGPRAYLDVSAKLRERADRNGPAPSMVEVWLRQAMLGHALNLDVAAFSGYALATLIRRRPSHPVPAARPRPKAVPGPSYRARSPSQYERSSIRFR